MKFRSTRLSTLYGCFTYTRRGKEENGQKKRSCEVSIFLSRPRSLYDREICLLYMVFPLCSTLIYVSISRFATFVFLSVYLRTSAPTFSHHSREAKKKKKSINLH